MRPRGWASWAVLLWGCGCTPFLISDFERDYGPKLKTIAILPFSLPPQNSLAEKYGPSLEEWLSGAIAQRDSLRIFIFPKVLRTRLGGRTDSAILIMPAGELGKRTSTEGLLYTRIVRLYEAAGSNPTSREIGAARLQRRGVELFVEFQLVEAASGKVLWKYRVRRFGGDVEAAGHWVGRAAAEAWPLSS